MCGHGHRGRVRACRVVRARTRYACDAFASPVSDAPSRARRLCRADARSSGEGALRVTRRGTVQRKRERVGRSLGLSRPPTDGDPLYVATMGSCFFGYTSLSTSDTSEPPSTSDSTTRTSFSIPRFKGLSLRRGGIALCGPVAAAISRSCAAISFSDAFCERDDVVYWYLIQ